MHRDIIDLLTKRIARFEEAICDLLAERVGELPSGGWLNDNEKSRRALQHLADMVPTQVVECGCCGHYHRIAYRGDCRNDAERFTYDQLDEKFGDWVEVES